MTHLIINTTIFNINNTVYIYLNVKTKRTQIQERENPNETDKPESLFVFASSGVYTSAVVYHDTVFACVVNSVG